MKTTHTLGALLLASGFLMTSCKQGEEKKMEETTTVETPTQTVDTAAVAPSGDSAFLAEVSQVNNEEIELGKLAQSRSMSKDVKDLGKMMVDGHTKAQSELIGLAKAKNISLPEGLSDKGKQAVADLTAATPKDFDKMYSDKMVEGHTETISKFEAARDNTADADTKAWIVKMLPDLKMHLDHSVTVQQKVNKK